MGIGAVNLRVWAATFAVAVAAAVAAVLVAGIDSAGAAFPGSNGAIAFDTVDHIYKMHPDGDRAVKLSDTADFNYNPTWSADGKKIAFVNDPPGAAPNEIYWMNSDGFTEINLTKHPANDLEPAFFPNRSSNQYNIAFISDRDAGSDTDIYVMTVSGAGQTNETIKLTKNPGFEFNPAVSPDGKKLVFNRDGDIYVMNANTPESKTNRPVKLTRSPRGDTMPDWSPDGKKIAFARALPSAADPDILQFEIFVMRAVPESKTNKPRRLTRHDGFDLRPAFSPDGRKIAFESDRSLSGAGRRDNNVWKMNADGSNVVPLTSSGGHDNNPSWQPDP